MRYEIEFKPRAIKDIRSVPRADARRILERVERMRQDMSGDVKRLTSFTPEYRLRVGDYRILFEAEGPRLVIYRVVHRREAYRG